MIGYLKVIRSLFERRLWQDVHKSFTYPLWIIYEEYVKDFWGFLKCSFCLKNTIFRYFSTSSLWRYEQGCLLVHLKTVLQLWRNLHGFLDETVRLFNIDYINKVAPLFKLSLSLDFVESTSVRRTYVWNAFLRWVPENYMWTCCCEPIRLIILWNST